MSEPPVHGSPAASEPDAAEVERLRVENEELRGSLARRGDSKQRLRRVTAAVLAFLAAALLVLSVVGRWTTQTAVNTDKFVARVGPIIDQPAVRDAITTEVTNQLVTTLDLSTRVQAALPQNLQFLAGPIAGAANDLVGKTVSHVVNGPRFRDVFYVALRLSQEQVIRLLSGSNANVQVVNGKIVVDLIGVIDLVLQDLASELPTVLGSAVSLQVPDNLPTEQIRAVVQKYLGIQLPDSFGQVPIMDASSLEAARTGYTVVNLSVVLLALVTLLAFVLALVASVDRRRTLLQFGFWVAGITAVVFFVVRAFTDAALANVGDETLRPAVTAGVHELFSSLRGFAALLFWLGLVLAVVMYLIGPGRFPVWLRGVTAKGGRWTAARYRDVAEHEGLAAWVGAHLDALRIGGVVVAAVLLLLLTSWVALFVIGVLLVLYEVGVIFWGRSALAVATDGSEEPLVLVGHGSDVL